jgi:glyoxylase-like metal-dependent hydrolase (beta-lactamase superfamily II)
MKHIVYFSLLSLYLQAFDYNLTPQRVAEDVYCFFGKPENISKENGGNIVNTCFVKTKEGFVVIDSGPTFAYAEQAYIQMQKIAILPVKYVINTHDHDDHWLGNSFYKSKGTLLIGPRTYEQNIVAGMQTRMERNLGKELYGKTSIVELDTIVEEKLSLDVGEKKFEIRQLEDIAHTKGDLIVYESNTSVLFAGDLVFTDRLTSLRDGSLLGSLKALKTIDGYNAKVVVGGHGYASGPNTTKVLNSYLSEMKIKVLDALDNDIGMEEITKKVPMLKYKDIKLYDLLHSRNILDAYKELEMIEDEDE